MARALDIPVQDWLPDRPSFQNPGCETADNVIPTEGGFGPFPGPVPSSESYTSAVKGARQLFTPSSDSVVVGGMDDRLFVRRSNVAETSGLSSIGDGERWDFAQFNNFVFATAQNNAPQYLDNVASDNTWSAAPGSPPSAKVCARVLDFLMLGNIAGAENRFQWGPVNNPLGDWTPSRQTQAGIADLDPSGGELQRIVGGRFPMILQERAIRRLSYVGPPVVWDAQVISEDKGTLAPFSVVSVGYFTFFLSQDGFAVTNGSTEQSIGSKRVNEWFFDKVDTLKIREVQGAVDWNNRCIIWGFHQNSVNEFDRAIIYAWRQNRWSSATFSAQQYVDSPQDGVTLEELGEQFPNLDEIEVSLDSDQWSQGKLILNSFSLDENDVVRYNNMTGAPLTARWQTGDFQIGAGRSVYVSAARPQIDANDWDARFSLECRNSRNERNQSLEMPTGRDGWAPVRGEGNTLAMTVVKPSGEWSDMSAITVEYTPAGGR